MNQLAPLATTKKYLQGTSSGKTYAVIAERGGIGIGLKPVYMNFLSKHAVLIVRLRAAPIEGQPQEMQYDTAFPEFVWEHDSGVHVRTHLRLVVKTGSDKTYDQVIDEAAGQFCTYMEQMMPGEFVSKADVSEHLKAAWGSALQEYEKQENMLNDASDQLVVNVAAEREKSKKHVLAASGSKPFEIPDGGQQGHGDKAFQYGGAPPQPVVLGDDDDPKANHDLQNIGGDDNYGDDDND